jgi:4'-phosphopantetheinyl transferase EntD
MLASLLAGDVAVAVATADDYDAPLEPIEAQQIAAAVESRRRAFAAGRACARRALVRLGAKPAAIPRGPGREPGWPPGFVGSITHTDGYCAAAVARADAYRAIGIDAERRRLPDAAVIRRFATEREIASGLQIAGEPVPLLWFSAKEAFYKTWSAAGGRYLDYLQAEIALDPAAGQFTVLLTSGETAGALRGSFAVTDEHVFTAVAMRRRHRAAPEP